MTQGMTMNRLHDEFLAGPGLSGHKNGCVRRSDTLNQVHDPLHLRGLTNNQRTALVLLQSFAERLIFPPQIELLKNFRYNQPDFIHLKRLHNVISRSQT